MIYTPKRFKAFEITDSATYAKFGEQAFQFFRIEALQMLDQLSDLFKDRAITINNWKSGGEFQWRGLRTLDYPEKDANGQPKSPRSAHRLGAAFDFNVSGLTPQQVYQIILAAKPSKIRRMEDISITTGWTHCDTYEWDGDGILIVKP